MEREYTLRDALENFYDSAAIGSGTGTDEIHKMLKNASYGMEDIAELRREFGSDKRFRDFERVAKSVCLLRAYS